MLHWRPSEKSSRSVVLVTDDPYGNNVDAFVNECVKWCRDNRFWYRQPTFGTISFLKDRDVISFLLRWG